MSELGQKVIAAVRAHAAAKADYVYIPPDEEPEEGISGTCVYVIDGAPSCLLGKGFWDLGLIDANAETELMNTLPFSPYNRDHFGFMTSMEEEEIDWLQSVQEQQDTKQPWGQAVAYADGQVDECGDPVEDEDE